VVSFCLQAAAPWYVTGEYHFSVLAVCGVNPEGTRLWYSGVDSAERVRAGKAYEAALGVTKLLTENIPQSILQIAMMRETGANNMVYLSVALSLLMAFKSFVIGVQFFCSSEYADRGRGHEELREDE